MTVGQLPQTGMYDLLTFSLAPMRKKFKKVLLGSVKEQATSDGKLKESYYERAALLLASVQVVKNKYITFFVLDLLEQEVSAFFSASTKKMGVVGFEEWIQRLVRALILLESIKREYKVDVFGLEELELTQLRQLTALLLTVETKKSLRETKHHRADDHIRPHFSSIYDDIRKCDASSVVVNHFLDNDKSTKDITNVIRKKANVFHPTTACLPNKILVMSHDPVDELDSDPVDELDPDPVDELDPDPVDELDPDSVDDSEAELDPIAIDDRFDGDLPPLPHEWRADKLAVVCQLLEAGANRQILQAIEESVPRRSVSDVDEGVEESAMKSNSDVDEFLFDKAQANNPPVAKRRQPHQDYTECQESHPALLSAWWIAVAEANQGEGNHDEASRVLVGVVEHGLRNGLLGDVSYANYLLGVMELTNHRPVDAIQYFKKAIELHALDPPTACSFLGKDKRVTICAIFSRLGMAHKHAQNIDSAVQSYQKAIAAGESTTDQPTSVTDAHINLGNLFHSVGDHTAAVSHCKKGIEFSKRCGNMVSHAWAHGNLGNTYLSLSQHKLAFHHLQQSLDLTLEHEPTPTAIGRAYNNLGTYYQAVGDLDKAQESYDTALGHGVYGQDQADHARAYGNIGKVYLLKKNPERAVPHYSEVLRLSRDRLTTAIARHNRGCAYFELGEKKKVLKQSSRRPNQYLVCGEAACMTESDHRLVCSNLKDANRYHQLPLTMHELNAIRHTDKQTVVSSRSDVCTSSVVPSSIISRSQSAPSESDTSVMPYSSDYSQSTHSDTSILSDVSFSESNTSVMPYSSDSSQPASSVSVVSCDSASSDTTLPDFLFGQSKQHNFSPRQCEDPHVKLPLIAPRATLSQAATLMDAQYYSAIVQMLFDVEVSWESPELEAAKNILLGMALMKLKMYDEATEVFQNATLFAEGASSHLYLGEIELIKHCPSNAAHHIEMALNLYNNLSQHLFHLIDTPKPSRCAVLSKLAMAYMNADKVGDAVQSYQQAIAAGETTEQPTTDADLAAAHIKLGNLLHLVGDHTAAVPHYKKGIELSYRCNDMVSHAWAHGNLGNTYLSLSQHKLAFHHLRLSLDLTLDFEPTPTAIGRAYNNLGTYYQAVGDLDKAQESYDTALGHSVYGQDQAGQARAYGNIGNVYMLKKNIERAILHYSEMIRLSRDRLSTDIAHHKRGCAYFELGGKNVFDAAQCPNEYLFEEVSCMMESEHRLVCPSPEDAKHYHHALKDFDKVIVGHEETFASIKGSPSGLNLSVAWFETNAKTFLRAQDCAYSIGDHNRALVYAEQCRARTLGELLNSKTGHRSDSFNTPLQPNSILSVVRHLKTPNVPVVVLSYTGTRLLVWVLVWDGEEVKMTAFEQEPKEEMFDGKTFDHYIRYSLSEMLTGGLQLYGGLEDQTVSDESPAAKLFELIGRPLLRILEVMGCSGSRIVLIPDSYTKLLPFSALYDSKRQCFLGDSHSIVYSPSLLTLGVMSQMPPVDVHVPLDSDGMCVVGNPTTPPFKFNKEEWDLGPLPYATEEARSVALMLQTTPLLHQEATKDNVLSKIRRAKVVHLATHGSAGGGFLVLGSSSHNFTTVTKHTVEDPSTLLLHASELESLDIPAALVVLSSCDSGRGVIRGDDIQGMARSFLLAGARAVLTSLCNAPDESANLLMQFFYRYLLDGHKASEALQRASHSIRCFAKYSNFVHWSGHQLTGQDVMVTHTLSSEDRDVCATLGIDSTTFPRFEVLHCLTDVLTNGSQTDIQLLCGPPGADLVEPVTDFICSNYTHYPGGIVWLNSNDRSSLQRLPKSSDHALVILDGYDYEDFSSTTCLNSSNIDVIIISNGLADETRHHVSSSLNQPVSVHEVKPLLELHATQRLVYSVQSSFHLPPTAGDQSAFQQLAHLTMGSPILVRMVQYLLHHNMKHSNTPSEGLLNTVHSIEDMLDDDDVLSTSRLAVVSAVCSTLSTAAQRLLHCLSCLDGLPVPLECIETIANMIQPPGQPLVTELRQAAVLLGYPSPVVIPTTVTQSPLLYVPVTVTETVWTASSLHNKALSLLLIKSAILKGPYSADTVCHQVLKSWETTMISDSQDCDSAVVLCLKEHIIELMEKCRPVKPADIFRICLPLRIDIEQSCMLQPCIGFSADHPGGCNLSLNPLAAHDEDKPLSHLMKFPNQFSAPFCEGEDMNKKLEYNALVGGSDKKSIKQLLWTLN